MADPTLTETLDGMYTTTWRSQRDKEVEQLLKRTRLFYWLQANQKVTMNGSRRIDIPLSYVANNTAEMFGRGHVFPVVETEHLTIAQFDWKNIGITITRFWTDDLANMGKYEIIGKVEADIRRARLDLTQKLEEQSFGDGSGTNDICGLQKMVDSTPATGTVGNINAANYSWWRNQQQSMSGRAASVYLLDDMFNQFNDVAQYGGNPDYIITTQTVYELYNKEATEQKQIVNKKMGDAQFTSLSWMGIPLVWAPECPSGNMYFIDSDHIDLMVHPSANFIMTPWKEVTQQLDKVAYIVAQLALVTDKRRAHGVLTAIAA